MQLFDYRRGVSALPMTWPPRAPIALSRQTTTNEQRQCALAMLQLHCAQQNETLCRSWHMHGFNTQSQHVSWPRQAVVMFASLAILLECSCGH
jgi:hypothetical protein